MPYRNASRVSDSHILLTSSNMLLKLFNGFGVYVCCVCVCVDTYVMIHRQVHLPMPCYDFSFL